MKFLIFVLNHAYLMDCIAGRAGFGKTAQTLVSSSKLLKQNILSTVMISRRHRKWKIQALYTSLPKP